MWSSWLLVFDYVMLFCCYQNIIYSIGKTLKLFLICFVKSYELSNIVCRLPQKSQPLWLAIQFHTIWDFFSNHKFELIIIIAHNHTAKQYRQYFHYGFVKIRSANFPRSQKTRWHLTTGCLIYREFIALRAAWRGQYDLPISCTANLIEGGGAGGG